MVKKLYEVRNRSGDLILENATSGEIRETLHCTTAQGNNARTSGDHIFGEYEENEIFREMLSPGNKQAVGRKENDSKLLLGLREAERNCNTIHKSMGRHQNTYTTGSGCTDKTVCRHRNQHFRSSGKFIRSKYEKCGKYNKKH